MVQIEVTVKDVCLMAQTKTKEELDAILSKFDPTALKNYILEELYYKSVEDKDLADDLKSGAYN